MAMIDLLCFLFSIVLAYAGFKLSWLLYGDYFAPLGLFLGVNLVALSLAQLNLLSMVPLTVEAYALMAVAFVSFICGVMVVSAMGDSTWTMLPSITKASQGGGDARAIAAFYYLTAFLGIGSWSYYVFVLMSKGWVTQLWMLQNSGADIIMPFHTGYLKVFGALVPPTFVLLWNARGRISFLSLLVLLLQMLALALMGIKMYLVIGLCAAFLVFNAVRPNTIRFRHMAYLSVILIGFMVLYDRFIDIFVGGQIPGSKFPDWLSFLEKPYIYVVGPLHGMTEIMANPPDVQNVGQVAMEMIWKILGPQGIGLSSARVVEYFPMVNIGSGVINVYTLIGEVFWDWGWIGMIFCCFCLGMVSTAIYVRARARGAWVMQLLNGIFLFGLLISFFAYYYKSTLFSLLLYSIIMGGALNRIFLQRRCNNTESSLFCDDLG
jgi:oligosaccharide repeat unit polymerase